MFNRDPKAPFCFSVLTSDGRLCASAQLPGVPLSREQMQRAMSASAEPPRELDTAPWCFEPHHGIVLYDEADRPVAAISVCFECERQGLWPPQTGHEYEFPPLPLLAERAFRSLLCEELGLTPCAR